MGIDVSEKARKVSKTGNALDVHRLPAPLKTSKRFCGGSDSFRHQRQEGGRSDVSAPNPLAGHLVDAPIQNEDYHQGYIESRAGSENLVTDILTQQAPAKSIEVKVNITFQDGDRFNSCQVIYSQFGLAIHHE
ncbi:hypothetical protein TNCV_2610891 [Trichonephila clavipes]|nr:hypothetical protein TNCV_2610891 [Trichonephila clavipes]